MSVRVTLRLPDGNAIDFRVDGEVQFGRVIKRHDVSELHPEWKATELGEPYFEFTVTEADAQVNYDQLAEFWLQLLHAEIFERRYRENEPYHDAMDRVTESSVLREHQRQQEQRSD